MTESAFPSPFIGAYWGAREETAESCAARISDALRVFESASPTLAKWFPKQDRAAVGDARAITPRSDILTLLQQNRTDVGDEVIDSLGYQVSWWNGDRAMASDLRVSCGVTSPRVSNACVLGLPTTPSLCGWLSLAGAHDLVLGIIDAFAPEWCALSSSDWTREQDRIGRPVGWLTYGAQLDKTTLPAGAYAESVAKHGGQLVVATADCSNHLADAVMGVANALL